MFLSSTYPGNEGITYFALDGVRVWEGNVIVLRDREQIVAANRHQLLGRLLEKRFQYSIEMSSLVLR